MKTILIGIVITTIAFVLSCKKSPYADSQLLGYEWRFDSVSYFNSNDYQKDTSSVQPVFFCSFYADKGVAFGNHSLSANGTFDYDAEHHLTCHNLQRFILLPVEFVWFDTLEAVMTNANAYSINGYVLTIECYNSTKKAKFTRTM